METTTPFIIFKWLTVKTFVIFIDLFEYLQTKLYLLNSRHLPRPLRFPSRRKHLWIRIALKCFLFSRKLHKFMRVTFMSLMSGCGKPTYSERSITLSFLYIYKIPEKRRLKKGAPRSGMVCQNSRLLVFFTFQFPYSDSGKWVNGGWKKCMWVRLFSLVWWATSLTSAFSLCQYHTQQSNG